MFSVPIDYLRNGKTHKVAGTFPPTFLDVKEKDLLFSSPVDVRLECYLSEDQVIVHVKAATEAQMACKICNQMSSFSLSAPDFCHTFPLEDVSGNEIDLSPLVREALLLELPQAIECGGRCKERESLAPFLSSQAKCEEHFPFANLEKKL